MTKVNLIAFEFRYEIEDCVGRVELIGKAETLPLHEYVIAPSCHWDRETKQFVFDGWGMVHRSHIGPEYAKAMEDLEAEAKK
jgi:hypothetical protein